MERVLFRFFILLIFFFLGGGEGRRGFFCSCLRCFQKTDTNGILFLHAVLIYIHKQWNSAQYVEAEQNKYYERNIYIYIYIYIYFFFFSLHIILLCKWNLQDGRWKSDLRVRLVFFCLH